MSVGGYRKGSGRSKHGYYKGIYCASTYELCWVIYNLDHRIKFSRFPGYLQRNNIKYYPDFLLDGEKTIVETKGYELKDAVDIKTKLAESFGYKVIVLRKDDLSGMFEYVKNKFKTNAFYTLYDNYKPKYNYKCCNCNKEFQKDSKLKTNNVFCSRACSGKFRKTNNILKSKNRTTKGNYVRKLTKEQALNIYNDLNYSYSQLSKIYNINVSAIAFIKNKVSYKWIH